MQGILVPYYLIHSLFIILRKVNLSLPKQATEGNLLTLRHEVYF
jgi:hypothetical protein